MTPTTSCQILIEDDTPVYTGGDIVAGYLEVSTTLNEKFNVAISFEGHTRTWLSFDNVKDQVHVVPTAEYRFLKESQHQKVDSSFLQFSNGKLTYQFPFEFTVPNRLISSHSDIPAELLDLPPTLKEGATLTKGGKTYMQPLITYLIKASVSGQLSSTVQKAPTLCTAETEIVIEPTVRPGVGPPREIKATLPMDHHGATCTKSIKRHSWSRPIGELTLTAEEPSPLNTSTSALSTSTTLPITLAFHPFRGIIPPNKPDPPNWTFEITTSIHTNSFFSTHKFTEIPSVSSTSKNKYIGHHSSTTTPETKEFVEPEWRTWRECLCVDENNELTKVDSNDPCWTTILNVPVASTKSLQQDYQSIYSAINHTLNVKVHVKNSMHESLELEIPLQVVNDPSLIIRETLKDTPLGHAAPMVMMNGFALETQVNGKGFSYSETNVGSSVMTV